jgi:ubiquitin-conjugating enzyme E2 A
LLQHSWSAANGVDAIVSSIQTLLVTPNPNSPADVTAADLFAKNFRENQRRVRKCYDKICLD